MPQDTGEWRFPPPKVARGWFWASIAATSLSVLALLGVVATLVVVEQGDVPGVVDDTAVLELIDETCADMTSSVEGLPPGQTPRDRALVVADQNAAIERMLERLDALEPDEIAGDEPLADWLADWRDLIDARTEYAELVVRDDSLTEHVIEVPDDPDGHPITERMEDALLDPVCAVPSVLVDPTAGDDLSI